MAASNNGESVDKSEILKRLLEDLTSHVGTIKEDPHLDRKVIFFFSQDYY